MRRLFWRIFVIVSVPIFIVSFGANLPGSDPYYFAMQAAFQDSMVELAVTNSGPSIAFGNGIIRSLPAMQHFRVLSGGRGGFEVGDPTPLNLEVAVAPGFGCGRRYQFLDFTYGYLSDAGAHGFVLEFPYWSVVLCSGAVVVFWWKGERKKRITAAHGLCQNCGYDLRESVERCPECGLAVLTPADRD